MISRSEKNKEIREKIVHEEVSKRAKKIIKIIGIILGSIFLIICYGMFVGAKVTLVREQKITSNKIPSSLHGLKIVSISDILYKSLNNNDLNKIKNQINEINPDIIIFTGNLKKEEYKLNHDDINNLTTFFKNLNSKMAKYAVIGKYDDDTFYVIMENSNFKIINNQIDNLYYKDTTPISFIGFNTKELDYSNIENKDNYAICILSNPDKIDDILKNINCNLALAGDTLGGEIKIFNKGLFDNHKYSNSYYKINNTELYISNGLGNIDNIRLFNHPSINLYRLTKY